MPPVSEAQFAFWVGFALSLKGGPRGIRASDLQAPSPNCLVVHPLDLPKSTKISKIQNPQNPKSKIPQIQNPQNPKSKIPRIQNPKSKIPKFWILGILDFGSLCSKSLCEAPNAPNFGFWRKILDLGDFGDFGVWGFWILDFVTNFRFYIRKEDCARRTGSADFSTPPEWMTVWLWIT